MLALGRVIGGIIFTLSLTFGVGVEATVNTQEVVSGNVVIYSIKATGKDVVFPSVVSIGGNHIIKSGDEKHLSYSNVNGTSVTQESTIRKFAFKPKQSMTIPSYAVTVDGTVYRTNAIKITVVKSSTSAMQQKKKFAFVLKSNKKSVTVGEPFVLTLYLTLLNTSGVRQVGNYVEPSSSDIVLKALGKQKQYTKSNQTIIEKSYSAIATKEGNISISPATAQLGISDGRQRSFFANLNLRWIEVSSNRLTIEVVKQEQESDLLGEFHLKYTLDKKKVKANTPVNLTVTIEGKGDLETFEFPKYEIDGVTIYSDDAKVVSQKVGNDIVSRYSKSFVFISDSSFEIPKRAITAYNPNSKKISTLSIPSYHIEVEQAKKEIVPAGVASSTPNNPIPKQEVKVKIERVVAWWMLVLAFILGMLAMLLIRWISTLKRERPYSQDEALKLLYAHISEDEEIEEMVRKLYAKKRGDSSVQIDKKSLKSLVDRVKLKR